MHMLEGTVTYNVETLLLYAFRFLAIRHLTGGLTVSIEGA